VQKKSTTLPFSFSEFAKKRIAKPNVINKYNKEGGYLDGLKNEIKSLAVVS
jgi:hypothetical protein